MPSWMCVSCAQSCQIANGKDYVWFDDRWSQQMASSIGESHKYTIFFSLYRNKVHFAPNDDDWIDRTLPQEDYIFFLSFLRFKSILLSLSSLSVCVFCLFICTIPSEWNAMYSTVRFVSSLNSVFQWKALCFLNVLLLFYGCWMMLFFFTPSDSKNV